MARRDPDFARRDLIAKARGFKSFYQWRVAAAAHPKPRRSDERIRSGSGGQEMLTTRSEGAIRDFIARAARNDLTLYARVTILQPPESVRAQTFQGVAPIGEWRTRDVEIWAAYGWRADLADEAVAEEGIALAVIKQTLDAMDRYPGPILDVLLRAVAA